MKGIMKVFSKESKNTRKNSTKDETKKVSVFTNKFFNKKALFITLIYFILGCAWILITDHLVITFLEDLDNYLHLNIGKGLFYVSVTALVIYMLIYRALKKTEAANRDLKKANASLDNSNIKLTKLMEEESIKALTLQALIDSVTDQIYYKDVNYRYLGCNKAFLDFNNLSITDCLNKSDQDIFGPYEKGYYSHLDKDVVEFQEKVSGQYEVYKKDEDKLHVFKIEKTPLLDHENRCIGLVGISKDITERKAKEKEIFYLSNHDSLTGFYNKDYIFQYLQKQIEQDDLPLSLIYAEIKGLKIINDALGIYYGDETIKAIANCFKSIIPKDAIIARVGGDQFVILLKKTDELTTQSYLDEIYNKCDQNMKSEKPSFFASLSLGKSTLNNKALSITGLLAKAEEDMYKDKGRTHANYNKDVLSAMMKEVFSYGTETKEHTLRLVALSEKVGKHMNLSSKEIDTLKKLSHYHDIGYIGLNRRMFSKNDKLSKNEWEMVQKHPEIGYRISQSISSLNHTSEHILYHHERWDGIGYPLGLKEEEIPKLSRIFSILDSYDVMLAGRPYKKALTQDQAKNELLEMAGLQFDPNLVREIVEII